MSTKKYFAEQRGSQHGAYELHWPGTPDGFPVIRQPGTSFDLKQAEVDALEYQRDFKSKMFELWDDAQKREFDDINDKIVNGWYTLEKRTDHWDEEKKHFRVWMEWCQIYGTLPAK